MKLRGVVLLLVVVALAACGAKTLPASKYSVVDSSKLQIDNASPAVGQKVTLTINLSDPSSHSRSERLDLEVADGKTWRTVGYLLIPATTGNQSFVPVADKEPFTPAVAIFADAPVTFEVPDVKAGHYRVVVPLDGTAQGPSKVLATEFEVHK